MNQISEVVDCVVSETSKGGFQKGERLSFKILREIRHLTGRRRVWHALRDEHEVLVKCFMPHRKQQRDVRREWTSALFLDRNNIRVPTPLFKAVTDRGDILVVYEFLSNASEVAELVRTEDADAIEDSLKQLVQVHGKMHELGAYQTDDHLANYLWLNREVYVIDAGTVVLKKAPLSSSQRVNNMAILLSYTSANLHAVLLHEINSTNVFYESISDRSAYIGKLLKRTDKEIRKRLAKYVRKTRRTSEEFIYKSDKSQEWHAHRKLQETTRVGFTGNAEALLNFTKSEQFVLEKFPQKSVWNKLKGGSQFPEALNDWSKSQVLRNFEVPVALALLCIVNRSDSKHDYLLSEKVKGLSLRQVLCDESFAQLLDVGQQLGRILLIIDSMGGNYDALSNEDFILNEEGVLQLVGISGLSFRKNRDTLDLMAVVKRNIIPVEMNDELRDRLSQGVELVLNKRFGESLKG